MLILLISVAIFVNSCASSRFASRSSYEEPEIEYQPKGRLESVIYTPTNQNISEKRMMVYLPESYDESGKSYPVIYVLHGARENELSWIKHGEVLEIIDELATRSTDDPTGKEAGFARECIVVMPNMNNYKDDEDYGNGRVLSMGRSMLSVTGGMEGSFMHDVVGRIDSLYRTVPDREHRAICGLSIGSMQSLYICANNPDDFGYLGLFSPFSKNVRRHDFYNDRKEKFDALFLGPNPPYCQIYVGTMDILYNHEQAFTKEWQNRGYKFELHEMLGIHDWPVWKAGLRGFSASFLE